MIIANILISIFKFSIAAGLFFVAVIIGMHVLGVLLKIVMNIIITIVITVGDLFMTKDEKEEK